jgi:hypothetical protein
MRIPRLAVLALALGGSLRSPAQTPRSVEALGAIVGVWQSDTVEGTAAVSSCAWTPRHGAVICEQLIRSGSTESRALDLYTFDAASGKYLFYLLQQPGEAMRPTPLAVNGRIWAYGGDRAAPDGKWYRTINDFSDTDSYSWKLETSANGKDWTPGLHGRSRRVP